MNDLTASAVLDEPVALAPAPAPQRWTLGWALLALVAAALLVGLFAWTAITSAGAPDPTDPKLSPSVALVDIGILVFREGLECILVLSAITASMVGPNRAHRRPVYAGAGVGFLATLVTWFVAVAIVSDLMENFSALDIQAATGLLAIVVLLVVMNWFFHNIYWGGWIKAHNRKKKELLSEAADAEITQRRLLLGLGLLGFSSLYREGFEVVLFLQSYHLKMGGAVVLGGALLGLFFTGIVAVLNFIAHRHLPYRRMLIVTGVLLGAVLLVMVGEQAFEMQQAHWLPTTEIAALKPYMPDWTGIWLSVFPTVETLAFQGVAAVLVIGSYFLARFKSRADAAAKV